MHSIKQPNNRLAPGELAPIYYWMGIVRLVGVPLIGGTIFTLWRLHILNFDPRVILYIILPSILF